MKFIINKTKLKEDDKHIKAFASINIEIDKDAEDELYAREHLTMGHITINTAHDFKPSVELKDLFMHEIWHLFFMTAKSIAKPFKMSIPSRNKIIRLTREINTMDLSKSELLEKSDEISATVFAQFHGIIEKTAKLLTNAYEEMGEKSTLEYNIFDGISKDNKISVGINLIIDEDEDKQNKQEQKNDTEIN